MKKIITLFLALVLVFSSTCITVFAAKASDYFETDLKIEFDVEALEYNRSLEFKIQYPEGNGKLDIYIDDVYYENIYIEVLSIQDTSGILDFSYFFDSNLDCYQGHFIPIDFGETQIVANFAAYGYDEDGKEVRIPGGEWIFTSTTDTITIEEMEIESGYFESSEEFTFDVSSYYQQLYESDYSENVSSDVEGSKGNVGLVIFIVVLALCVLLGAFVVYRNYNIKKYKKRR